MIITLVMFFCLISTISQQDEDNRVIPQMTVVSFIAHCVKNNKEIICAYTKLIAFFKDFRAQSISNGNSTRKKCVINSTFLKYFRAL